MSSKAKQQELQDEERWKQSEREQSYFMHLSGIRAARRHFWEPILIITIAVAVIAVVTGGVLALATL